MTSWWGHQSLRTLLIPFTYPYPGTAERPQQSGSAAPAVTEGLF